MLQTLHRHLNDRVPIYGMNRGSVGFLMNDYREDDLLGRLARAEINAIHPLAMRAVDRAGKRAQALAINEVSLFRETYQAAKLRISVDGKVRLRRADLRRRAGGDAGRLDRLQPVGATGRSCRSTRRCWR